MSCLGGGGGNYTEYIYFNPITFITKSLAIICEYGWENRFLLYMFILLIGQ